MYQPEDESYLQARAIKTGRHQLQPIHQQLTDWLSDEFRVSALDFNFETKKTSVGYPQQVIAVILETIAECDRLETTANRQLIAEKFMRYFILADQGLRKSDATKRKYFSPDEKPFPEIIVGFHALEIIELKVAKPKVKLNDLPALKKYKDHISGTSTFNDGMSWLVFYHSDAQVKENRTNGISAAIEGELLCELKKHDEFNYFGPHSVFVQFDSRESYDRDFGGKDYLYYR